MTGTTLPNRKHKYVPHLPTLLAVCEGNYARLMRLVPDCDSVDMTYRFAVASGNEYQVRILESSRYTSTLEMLQLSNGGPAYMQPVMQVRLYHDAKMAEVIHSQHVGALKPSYGYPNLRMHQKNEKEMVNRFLAEWLSFCLDQKAKQQSPTS